MVFRPGPRRLALAIALSLAAVLAALVASSAQAAPRSFYGVASQTFLEQREIERMGAGGIGTLRTILNWASVDPTKAPDDYNWSATDAIVGDAARSGIRVLPFLFGTPRWVAKGLDDRDCGSACETYAPRKAPARAAWREFLADAVDRYGRGGEFWNEHPQVPRKPITAWQIWNEQNSKTFYGPRPSARAYAALLDSAARAIRSRDRRADIVLGGMAELAGSRKATAGTKFLRQLYRRRGVQRNFDGVAPHPYGKTMQGVRAQVAGFRNEIERAGDGNSSLWITEIGWGSARGGNPLNRGRQGQARRLEQAFGYFARKRGALNVRNVTWFSWRDSAVSICDWCASSGLFTKSLSPKPSWRALKRLTPGR